MARIDGSNAPKIPSTSFKSIEPGVVDSAPATLPMPKAPVGLSGMSDLVGFKPKLQNLTGGRNRAALPDSPDKAALIAQLKEGMGNAGTLPSSLQIKGGKETKGETKAKPRSPDEIVKSLAGKSRVDTGEGLMQLSPAERKSVTDGIKAGTITDGAIVSAHLTSLSPKEQVALLQKLPQKALDGVKDVWRKGEIDSYPNVKMAVGIEMAARTPWGLDKANAGAVASLRKAASNDSIKSDLPLDHDAIATATKGKIRLKSTLLENPEATAAILAHEGTHLHQGTDCCGGKGASSPKGETEGTLAGIAVWDQLGKKNGNAAGSALETLNAQSNRLKSGGPALVEQKVLEGYRDQAKRKIDEGTYTSSKGDTKADWEAKVKDFEAALAKLKEGGSPGKAVAGAAIKGAGKGAD